jgi:hypothetical protein
MSSNDEQHSTFASTVGGVMTDEAGAITGELELATHHKDGCLHVRIRYAEAAEWYTVSGSPISEKSETSHEKIVEHLKTPGPVVSGNEEAVSLGNFNAS